MTTDWAFSISHTYKSSRLLWLDACAHIPACSSGEPGRPSLPHLTCAAARLFSRLQVSKFSHPRSRVKWKRWIGLSNLTNFSGNFKSETAVIVKICMSLATSLILLVLLGLLWTVSRPFWNRKSAKNIEVWQSKYGGSVWTFCMTHIANKSKMSFFWLAKPIWLFHLNFFRENALPKK